MIRRLRLLLFAALLAFGLPLHMAAGGAMAVEPVAGAMASSMQGDCRLGSGQHAHRDGAGKGFLAASCQAFCNSAAMVPERASGIGRPAICLMAFSDENAAVPNGCDLPPDPAPPRVA